MFKKFQILLTLTIILFISTSNLFSQSSCGNSFGVLSNPSTSSTLCSDGSDALNFVYNSADNLSSPSLPNFSYVIESPNGLNFLESGSVLLDPTDPAINAVNGDQICVTGFAVDLADVNSVISTLSNPFICLFAGIDAATCTAISNLNAQGGISNISDAINFATTLGLTPPTNTTDAINLLAATDSAAASLGGVCYSVSNLGSGYDYCYNVIDCCLPIIIHQEPFMPTQNLYEAGNYIQSSAIIEMTENVTYDAKNYVELIAGFEVEINTDFTALINGCN